MSKTDYNIDKVNSLIMSAKGTNEERSIRRYAQDAGVSAAGITRVLKGDYKATPQLIKKLTADRAKPKNNITFEMLMQAAGYVDVSEDEIDISYSDELIIQAEDKLKIQRNEFKVFGIGLITNTLIEKDIFPQYKKMDGSTGRKYNADCVLEIGEIKWVIQFVSFKNMRMNKWMPLLKSQLGKFIFLSLDASRKCSLVVDEQEVYDYLIKLKNTLSFKGNLSIILIDDKEIITEEYISYYSDDINEQKEILLFK